ncbi:MAG: sensor hybrid histidine kinase [Phycisphaerales bacterium]|nr:sensor hybrid histidine kinase [Phycisphaerales bacterium]
MASKKPVCVLAVEFDRSFSSALMSFLHRDGYTVRIARSSGAALALAAAGDCDLVISEIPLPDGTAASLMRTLKSQYGLKGIALCNGLPADDMAAAKAAGFDRIVPKPLNINLLKLAIEELMESAPPPAQ